MKDRFAKISTATRRNMQ